jgi:hypothetical protein
VKESATSRVGELCSIAWRRSFRFCRSKKGKCPARCRGICEAGGATIRRAHATHPLAAVQIEYSLWTRDVEAEILPLCEELGIGFVAYSPLGRGFLTGYIADVAALRAGDARRNMPRFQGDNLRRNLALVEELKAHAAAENCTPAQLALAWVLSRAPYIVPIPGTSHRRRLEDNAAVVSLEISADTEDALLHLFAPGAASGLRYPQNHLARPGIWPKFGDLLARRWWRFGAPPGGSRLVPGTAPGSQFETILLPSIANQVIGSSALKWHGISTPCSFTETTPSTVPRGAVDGTDGSIVLGGSVERLARGSGSSLAVRARPRCWPPRPRQPDAWRCAHGRG